MSFEMCNFDPAEENGLIASTREVYSGGKRNLRVTCRASAQS